MSDESDFVKFVYGKICRAEEEGDQVKPKEFYSKVQMTDKELGVVMEALEYFACLQAKLGTCDPEVIATIHDRVRLIQKIQPIARQSEIDDRKEFAARSAAAKKGALTRKARLGRAIHLPDGRVKDLIN